MRVRAGPSQASSAEASSGTARSTSRTRRRGEGNSTLAHTPSPDVRSANSEAIRWVSQRSIPRVGTATTSCAKGSSGGDASISHNPPTNSSGCDPTWISSATSRRPIGPERVSGAGPPQSRTYHPTPTHRIHRQSQRGDRDPDPGGPHLGCSPASCCGAPPVPWQALRPPSV